MPPVFTATSLLVEKERNEEMDVEGKERKKEIEKEREERKERVKKRSVHDEVRLDGL